MIAPAQLGVYLKEGDEGAFAYDDRNFPIFPY